MKVLVIEPDRNLGRLWCRYLMREGCKAITAVDQDTALNALRFADFDALVLDLDLPDPAVMAISDFATYRNPAVAIIIVSANRFFSDGTIFDIIPNVRSHIQTGTSPDDLAAIVGHYGRMVAP